MKNNTFACFCALIFFTGCHNFQYVSDNLEGEYFFYFDEEDVYPSLPSITINSDSTFDYIVPGVGGPYHSNGTWRRTPSGLLLSTQLTCVGANVKKITGESTMDSIDLFVSFLVSTIQPDSIRIGNNVFFLGSRNHFRTTAKVLMESEFIYNNFDVYPICILDSVTNGNVYQVILVDNPYYPIIDNEVWTIEKGLLKRPLSDGICMFRKGNITGLK